MQTMLTKKKIVGLALLCCAAVTIAIVLTFVLNSTAKAEEPPRYSASPGDVYTLSVQQPASVYQQEYQDQTQFHRVAGSGNSPDCEVHFLCQRRVFSSAAGGFFTRRFWISDFKPYICGPPPRQTRCGADETHETRI